MDLLIKNGWLLTMNDTFEIIENGWVGVDGQRIIRVGSVDGGMPEPADQVIDAEGGIIMPGLVNGHTQVLTTLFRGFSQPVEAGTEMSFLHSSQAPVTGRDAVYLGAVLACAEMIRSGTTCFCDSDFFAAQVARAAVDAGLRTVACEAYSPGTVLNSDVCQDVEFRLSELMESWKDHSLVTPGLSLDFDRIDNKKPVEVAARIATKHQLKIFVSGGRRQSQSGNVMNRYAKKRALLLAQCGIQGPNLIMGHGNHLLEEEIQQFREQGAGLVHCPEFEMKHTLGVAPVPAWLNQGLTVGIGTGSAADNDFDLFLEMDTAAKLHKVMALNPEVMDAATVLKMATINGARVLGLDSTIGSIVPGKRADIIIIDTAKHHLIPLYHPVSHLVYSASGRDVSTVLVNGRVLMKKREMLTLDLEKIMDKAAAFC